MEEDHYANVYAAALLGYFQEPSAHLPIIRAFCIGNEEKEELWGDMVTEKLQKENRKSIKEEKQTVRKMTYNLLI